jgi:hypothetical protein
MTLGRVLCCTLWVCGCAEAELERTPTAIADAVEISSRAPGAACAPLETLEVHSGKHDSPTTEVLRQYAWQRAANYVVLDTFSVYDEKDADVVLVRARLYRCPPLTPYGARTFIPESCGLVSLPARRERWKNDSCLSPLGS